MPIPAFDSEGLLTRGGHPATEAEIETQLVVAFPASGTRKPIFEMWRQHRRALAHIIAPISQWVDGSFVTDKVDPGDVDLVTILDGPQHDALPLHLKLLVRTLLNGPATRDFWSCDSYFVFQYPAGHPGHQPMLDALDYWSNWFGRTRDGAPKGYLVVT